MIPGLASEAEERLLAAIDKRATSMTAADWAERDFTIVDAHSAEAGALGITATGAADALVVVTDPARPVGRIEMAVSGQDALLFVDNSGGGDVHANLRLLGDNAVVFINAPGNGTATLRTAFLRSHDQFLFWGRGATAVDLSIEIEGVGQGVVVGDDALIAGGVWVRNHDMHAMHDLASGRRLTRPPVTTVVERHVWLGEGALLLSCSRIGAGTIVGAGSMVKGVLPPCVAAVGRPARILREGISWGRDLAGMTAAERRMLDLPPLPGAT